MCWVAYKTPGEDGKRGYDHIFLDRFKKEVARVVRHGHPLVPIPAQCNPPALLAETDRLWGLRRPKLPTTAAGCWTVEEAALDNFWRRSKGQPAMYYQIRAHQARDGRMKTA